MDERALAGVCFRRTILVYRGCDSRGYDFVQTLGFVWVNFGLIFGLAVVAGPGLYGLGNAVGRT